MTIESPDLDPTPALQDEFWGEQAEWVTTDRRPPGQRAGLGAAAGRWWGGLLGAGARAERMHGQVKPARGDDAPHDGGATESSTPDRVVHDIDDIDDAPEDGWTFEPQPQPNRRPGVDPLLARFGGVAVIATLAVPMLMGFVSGADSGALPTSSSSSAISIAPLAETAAPTPSVAEALAPGVDTTAAMASTVPVPVTADVSAQSQGDEPAAAALEADGSASALAGAEPADTEPVATAAPCGNRYELAAGDYWIRIADAADVRLADLLDVNDASVDTVLVPGRSICLPVGASTPAPPTTAAPSSAPSATSTATSTSTSGAVAASSPRTTTPTTTAPPDPTTTAPPRPAAVPVAEAVAIIREVWPDELEERALEIAWRESIHRSNVNNSCCYGLFQIHWTAHRSWLGSIGVTSAADLYDPRLNTVAAYMLYQRSGGFGPWGG